MVASKNSVEEWIRLTYDEDPKVRLKAAKALADVDSPFSEFALLELGYDKDKEVRAFSKKALNIRSQDVDEKTFSLSKLLLISSKTQKTENEEKKKNVLKKTKAKTLMAKFMPSIDKMFATDDLEKREKIKKLLMPSLDKLFERLADREDQIAKIFASNDINDDVDNNIDSKELIEPEDESFEDSTDERSEYLQALGQVERIIHGCESVDVKNSVDLPGLSFDEDGEEDEGVPEELPDNVIPRAEFADPLDEYLYERAYSIVTTPDITSAIIKKQMKNVMKEVNLRAKSAFQLAELKSKRVEILSLADLNGDLKSVFTPEVKVTLVEEKEVKRGTRPAILTRLVVADSKSTFPVHLWKGRGRGVYEGDRVKFENVAIETCKYTGETAIVLDTKKSRMVIVK